MSVCIDAVISWTLASSLAWVDCMVYLHNVARMLQDSSKWQCYRTLSNQQEGWLWLALSGLMSEFEPHLCIRSAKYSWEFDMTSEIQNTDIPTHTGWPHGIPPRRVWSLNREPMLHDSFITGLPANGNAIFSIISGTLSFVSDVLTQSKRQILLRISKSYMLKNRIFIAWY